MLKFLTHLSKVNLTQGYIKSGHNILSQIDVRFNTLLVNDLDFV